ncbi:hypothetical protein [Brumimicrobium sp.]|uniref:hypothetical protein n=1 Tax=Brumimicrobium sp. TaxID=2029867 RepID=UPI003A909786
MTENTKNKEKPSPEVKALSLYLMAHKKTSPTHLEQSKRINNLWNKVVAGNLSKSQYLEAVQQMLTSFGGYATVVEKTVEYYIKKTGEWTLKGDDKYSIDAQKVADALSKK